MSITMTIAEWKSLRSSIDPTNINAGFGFIVDSLYCLGADGLTEGTYTSDGESEDA